MLEGVFESVWAAWWVSAGQRLGGRRERVRFGDGEDLVAHPLFEPSAAQTLAGGPDPIQGLGVGAHVPPVKPEVSGSRRWLEWTDRVSMSQPLALYSSQGANGGSELLPER